MSTNNQCFFLFKYYIRAPIYSIGTDVVDEDTTTGVLSGIGEHYSLKSHWLKPDVSESLFCRIVYSSL